jgi:hypothetical protein
VWCVASACRLDESRRVRGVVASCVSNVSALGGAAPARSMRMRRLHVGPIKSNSPTACAVRERTGDGRSVGRCWFHVKGGECPRHGDVSKVQAEYARSGRLTDEADLYEARGVRPPWWG